MIDDQSTDSGEVGPDAQIRVFPEQVQLLVYPFVQMNGIGLASIPFDVKIEDLEPFCLCPF